MLADSEPSPAKLNDFSSQYPNISEDIIPAKNDKSPIIKQTDRDMFHDNVTKTRLTNLPKASNKNITKLDFDNNLFCKKYAYDFHERTLASLEAVAKNANINNEVSSAESSDESMVLYSEVPVYSSIDNSVTDKVSEYSLHERSPSKAGGKRANTSATITTSREQAGSSPSKRTSLINTRKTHGDPYICNTQEEQRYNLRTRSPSPSKTRRQSTTSNRKKHAGSLKRTHTMNSYDVLSFDDTYKEQQQEIERLYKQEYGSSPSPLYPVLHQLVAEQSTATRRYRKHAESLNKSQEKTTSPKETEEVFAMDMG